MLFSASSTALAVFVVKLVTATCIRTLEPMKPAAGASAVTARSFTTVAVRIRVLALTLFAVLVSPATVLAWAES